jgi:hypothetical protein
MDTIKRRRRLFVVGWKRAAPPIRPGLLAGPRPGRRQAVKAEAAKRGRDSVSLYGLRPVRFTAISSKRTCRRKVWKGRQPPTSPDFIKLAFRTLSDWICDPAVDVRFMPAGAMGADFELSRKRAVGDLAVDGGPGQTGSRCLIPGFDGALARRRAAAHCTGHRGQARHHRSFDVQRQAAFDRSAPASVPPAESGGDSHRIHARGRNTARGCGRRCV